MREKTRIFFFPKKKLNRHHPDPSMFGDVRTFSELHNQLHGPSEWVRFIWRLSDRQTDRQTHRQGETAHSTRVLTTGESLEQESIHAGEHSA